MESKIKTLGVMVDCSRDACYTVETVKKFIDIIGAMGYDVLMLYTEDTYELDGEPYFGYMRGRYTKEELKEIDRYALSRGIELVPCIQTLAHLGGITRWQEYGAKCVDDFDILLVDQAETYELIDKMFATLAECFTTRRAHIGMDEAYYVGLGRYLALHGFCERFEVLRNHLEHIRKIADKYGFSCMLWSDMFVKTANGGEYYPEEFKMTQEIVDSIPEEMQLVYWDYIHTDKAFYEKMIDGHRTFRNKLWFSGVAWSNLGFTPHNHHSFKVADAALAACAEKGVENVLITSWKDDGGESSIFSILPTLAYIAAYKEGRPGTDRAAEIFKAATGEDFESFLTADLPDRVNGEPELANPVKNAMYNDPFLGLYDYHLTEGHAEFFGKAKEKLEETEKTSAFGYIFRTLARTCDAMELKYDLGILTRRAYRERDTQTLKKLAYDIYPETARRIGKVYEAFRDQWETECKPNGFEVHDIRLGGLQRRIEHCGRMLRAYLEGRIEKIQPLEEDVLPYDVHKKQGEAFINSVWMNTVMTKPGN